MKRILCIAFIIFAFTTTNVLGQAILDTQHIDSGVIGIQYNNTSSNRIKAIIEKDGNKYTYNMNTQKEDFSLQMGNGNYNISLLENTQGNKYKVVFKETVNVNIREENREFLSSIQMINWNTSMKAIKKAQELVKDAKNDEEKVEKVYQYIINNIEFDFDKINTLTSDYLPQIDRVITEKKGICYDYASLFASMLRSVDIPTKLVMGYASGVNDYHAWNEVYIESKGQWLIIDTTVDAQYNKVKQKVDMFKSSSLYSKVYEY